MSREQMMRVLMVLSVTMTAVFGGLSLLLFLAAALSTDGIVLSAAFLSACAAAGTGVAGYFIAQQREDRSPVGSEIEHALLNHRQKSELRKARAAVVMEKALVDVEHERQNIVHNQIEASKDPTKPPHKTSFTEPEDRPSLSYPHDDLPWNRQ